MRYSPRIMPKSKEVDAWFARYDNPMKDVMIRIRDIVLGADPRIEECIKWQAPTFTFDGNLASFYPKAKQHASLMFHQGAKIPGKHPRLEGTGGTSRVLKVSSLAEADAAKPDLVRIVKAWCVWRAGAGATARAAKKGPATPRAKASAVAKRKTGAPKSTRRPGRP